MAAIERFCREQNPDLNNMSQDEYSFYWELTSETEQEYVVTYCSYTGSFTYFHVNKATGEVTTMEYVPDNGWRGSRSRGISDLGLYRLIYNYTG